MTDVTRPSGRLFPHAALAHARLAACLSRSGTRRTLALAALVGASNQDIRLVGSRAADLAHVFTRREPSREREVKSPAARLPVDGALWVSWPKRASGVATDAREDTLREIALPLGVVDVKVCAIDAIRSRLKTVCRFEARARKPGAVD